MKFADVEPLSDRELVALATQLDGLSRFGPASRVNLPGKTAKALVAEILAARARKAVVR